MNKNKVILSFPYSGALYHFIDKTLLGGRYANWSSGYYTWLFGKNPDKWVSMSLTFAIVYPEIVLAPRDHPLPKIIDGEIQSTYQDPDLGFIVDWDDYNGVRNILQERVDEDMQDLTIQKMLHRMRIPPHAASNLLYDIRYELHLSQKHKARLVCARGRKKIVDYLLKRDHARNFPNTASPQIQFVENYIEISGLEYNLDTIDDLYTLKEDEEIKKHSSAFRNQLHSLASNEANVSSNIFKQSAEDALAASSKARKYAKRFSRGTSYVSWSSLFLGWIPGVGTIATAVEKGLEVAAKTGEYDALQHEWFDFAPRVSSILSKSHFIKNVRQIKSNNK